MPGDDLSREEFLAAAKTRAHDYIKTPEPHRALTSLISDLIQRADTADAARVVILTGLPLVAAGHLTDRAALRKFIDDLV